MMTSSRLGHAYYCITELPSHRKCIGFADFQVDFLLQYLHNVAGAMKFQEQLNYEISNILTNSELMEPKRDGWSLKVSN